MIINSELLLPITDYRLPITDYPLPITDYPLPITDYPLPITKTMFLETSRYFRKKQVDVVTKDGRTVKALTLRRLPTVAGEPTLVEENDRLDIIAQRQYQNPTWFWHIADANTELEANELVREVGRIIQIPNS